MELNAEIENYIQTLDANDQKIGALLSEIICDKLPLAENKIWHRHPVWFLEQNPIVGFSKQKKGIRLMFWSGIDFEAPELNVHGTKFKDASIFYNAFEEININQLQSWLEKSACIQYDYKNIVKRKGNLIRLK